MSTTITGIVANGVVVPSSPLPEGARVDIHLQLIRPEVPPKLPGEFNDWEREGAGTVEMIERLAEAMEANEKQPRTSLADWAETKAEAWGTKLSSEEVDGFTGRRF
jgi:hypothetical protein